MVARMMILALALVAAVAGSSCSSDSPSRQQNRDSAQLDGFRDLHALERGSTDAPRDGARDHAGADTARNTLYLVDHGVSGDGTDQTSALASAISYAHNNGYDYVVFPTNGVVGLKSSSIRFLDGITYIGNGCALKRLDRVDSDVFLRFGAASSGSGLEAYGLVIDCNTMDIHSGGDGVYLNDNVNFHNNEVKNCREYSVSCYGSDNVTISSNTIHDGLQYGVCTGGGDESGRSHNITVTNNTIYNMMEVGIKVRGTTGATITGNTVTMGDSPNSGGDTPSHHTTVRGISLYSFDNSNDDILIQNNTVSGQYKGYDGDAISSDDQYNTNIRILSNIVAKCNIGIDIHFNNGTITGNTISQCTTCLYNGGSGNTVNNNPCM